MKYQILQGKIANDGSGDYVLINEFDNLEEAQTLFEKIKQDKKGWCLNYHEHLETLLIEKENFDDPVGYWSCDQE